jgi:hypothetical protein
MATVHYREVIRFFAEKFNYNSYLELGIRDASNCFNHIPCEVKEGVDIKPDCSPTWCMTTDEYFSTVGNEKTWDLIFIDASHEKNQVMRDFENSLKRLNKNGTIIMDDINPTEAWLLNPEFCDNAWETFGELGKRSNLEMHAIIGTYAGYVRVGKQTPHQLNIESTYEFLDTHREELVRPITYDELILKF